MTDTLTPDWASLRALFPGLQSKTYFDTASRGLLASPSITAINAMLERRLMGTADKAEMFALIERVRALVAQLIHAQSPTEIAYTKNVSEGLNIVASAVDWKRGDKVILCPELEHPSNLYPWLNLAERVGIEIVYIHSHDGFMPVEEMIAAIDDRTKVVTCSFVTFAPGLRSDLQRLAEVCDAREVLLLVDAAQGIGILDLDVSSLPVAAVSFSTQKGLLALYGMGFLYVRKDWAEKLSPVYLSRFSVDLGSGSHEASSSASYGLLPAALRYEVGNYNYIGAAGVEPALEILLKIGMPQVESRVLALNAQIVSGMQALDYPVFASHDGIHRGHMVAIGDALGTEHDATSDQDIQDFYAYLKEHEVGATIRRGLIRLSTHFYNDESDVAKLLTLAKNWKDGTSSAQRRTA